MARISLAAQSVVGVRLVARPQPLAELTQEQAEEWSRVVDSLPADWFRPETLGLLAQYCRHRVAARRIAQLVAAAESAEEFDFNEYDRLLRAQEREGRAISSLATRMRLTQQTSFDKERSKGRAAGKPKPWEVKPS